MSNKSFLAKYGDIETREALSGENGPHEKHIFDSHLPVTQKMVDNGMKSYNYNANTGAIKSTNNLSHDQMEHVIKNRPDLITALMIRKDIPHHLMVDAAIKHGADSYDVASSSSFTPEIAHEIVTHAKYDENKPYLHPAIAGSSVKLKPETVKLLADHAVKHNDIMTATALVKSSSDSKSVSASDIEPVLKHFVDSTSLHKTAASHAKLTDRIVSHYLKTPELAKRLTTNLKLTDHQTKMVPNHMFTELDILK